MKIGFLLQRITHLKTMGSLIQTSMEHGHKVFLFYTPNTTKGAKAYQNASGDKLKPLARLGAELVEIRMEEISTLGKRYGIDTLCMQEAFYNFNDWIEDLEELQRSGTRLVSLSHFFEIAQQPLEALQHFDKTFYISNFARDLHFELQQSTTGQRADLEGTADRWTVTGSPMFDQIEKVSSKEARRELNLPLDRKIVLLVDPVIAPTTPWRFHVWRDSSKLSRSRDALNAGKLSWLPEIWFGSTFKEIASEIKSFCERQNAILIVKSRGKQADSPYLSTVADVYIDGLKDEYFPVFSTYELLAASDLCITVNSMAAPEAVAAGVPCVNIYVPHIDRAIPTEAWRADYFERLLGGETDTLMNFTGCIWKVDRRKAAAWFGRHDMADVEIDIQRKKQYVNKFLGFEEDSSSQRILAELEA